MPSSRRRFQTPKTVLGMFDRGFKRLLEGHCVVCLRKYRPALHLTWDGLPERTPHRNLVQPSALEELDVGRLRRIAAAVETGKLVILGGVHQREHVSARARHHGDHQGRGRSGGHGRIDSGAPCCNFRRLTCDPSGWLAATIPFRATTAERPAFKSGRTPAVVRTQNPTAKTRRRQTEMLGLPRSE